MRPWLSTLVVLALGAAPAEAKCELNGIQTPVTKRSQVVVYTEYGERDNISACSLDNDARLYLTDSGPTDENFESLEERWLRISGPWIAWVSYSSDERGSRFRIAAGRPDGIGDRFAARLSDGDPDEVELSEDGLLVWQVDDAVWAKAAVDEHSVRVRRADGADPGSLQPRGSHLLRWTEHGAPHRALIGDRDNAALEFAAVALDAARAKVEHWLASLQV